jgi:hypothetical protein
LSGAEDSSNAAWRRLFETTPYTLSLPPAVRVSSPVKEMAGALFERDLE